MGKLTKHTLARLWLVILGILAIQWAIEIWTR